MYDISEMLLLIIIALQSTAANAFLEHCPIDRTLILGDRLVVDVLKTFYNDLVFVGAATDTCQKRDYAQVIAQLDDSGEQDRLLNDVAKLLSRNQFKIAEQSLSGNLNNEWYTGDVRRNSYLSYFQAEANRLMDNDAKAFEFVQKALANRQASVGISVQALERLNSLLTLKGVSRFNRYVDQVYGVFQSTNYEKLPLLHSSFEKNLAPFSEIRSKLANKFAEIINAEATKMERTNLELIDLSDQSVATANVESILCEFARKLELLGVSTSAPRSSYDEYHSVLLQAVEPPRTFDSGYDLRKAVGQFEESMTLANEALYELWKRSSLDKFQMVFIRYFIIEWDRRSKNSCYLLSKMQQGIDAIKRAREGHMGLTLSSLYILEAKVLFTSMDCVHRRVRSFYHLIGDEDVHELAAKQAEFGGGDRKLCLGALTRSET